MAKRQIIDTIIFDAGGVLFYINEFRNTIIKRVLFSMGYSELIIIKGLESVNDFDLKYFKSDNNICSWEDERKWLDARYKFLANVIDKGNLELADRLKYVAFDTYQYKLFDETIDVLNRLKKSYKLCVLSNATASLDWAFDFLDIRKYFEEVIISSYENCFKPDEKLYYIALEKLNKKSSQCVFIDDKIENVIAAEKIGINGYHLTRNNNDFEKYLLNLLI